MKFLLRGKYRLEDLRECFFPPFDNHQIDETNLDAANEALGKLAGQLNTFERFFQEELEANLVAAKEVCNFCLSKRCSFLQDSLVRFFQPFYF